MVDVSDEVALPVSDIRPRGGSSKSPVKDVVKTKPKEDDIEEKKAELVDAVTTAAENSEDEEEAWKQLEEDEMVAKLLAELEEDDSNTPTFNAARTSRMAKINDEFMEKSMRGKKIKDILTITPTNTELPSKHLKVDSINEEWTDMKFINFQENYDINTDIVRMLYSLSTKTYPIYIIDIKIEDTSTNMDYIDWFPERVSKLRMQKGVSARDMSLSLGQSESYINKIENKRTLPSLTGFFYICEYFGISPQEFFNDEAVAPAKANELMAEIEKLSPAISDHVLQIVKDFNTFTK